MCLYIYYRYRSVLSDKITDNRHECRMIKVVIKPSVGIYHLADECAHVELMGSMNHPGDPSLLTYSNRLNRDKGMRLCICMAMADRSKSQILTNLNFVISA